MEIEFAKKIDLDGAVKRVGELEGDFKVVKSDVAELKKDTGCLPDIRTTLALQGQTLASLSRNINRLIWLLVATLITGIGAIIIEYLKKGG
jgi:hypothetical protein